MSKQSRIRRFCSGRRLMMWGALSLILVAPALAFAQPASAPGAYIGGGIGKSTMLDADTTFLGVTTDNTDSAVKLFWGFMFNPNFGIELDYIDFGSFLGSSPSETWSPTGFNFSMVGVVPVPSQYSNFSLFGKVGANSWNVDDSVPSLGGTLSTSGTDLSYGVGAQLDFNPNVSANVQWERFNNVGDPSSTGRSDLRLVTLNLIYHFRWWGGRRY